MGAGGWLGEDRAVGNRWGGRMGIAARGVQETRISAAQRAGCVSLLPSSTVQLLDLLKRLPLALVFDPVTSVVTPRNASVWHS